AFVAGLVKVPSGLRLRHQSKAERATGGGENQRPRVGCRQAVDRRLTRNLTPAIDRTFEIADDRVAQRGQPCRGPIDPRKSTSREFTKQIRRSRRRRRPVPSTRRVLGEPVEHRAHRTGQQDEPEEDAEYVALCEKQSV